MDRTELAACLEAEIPTVLDAWDSLARASVPAARDYPTGILVYHFPRLLLHLADALRSVPEAGVSYASTVHEHARMRAGMPGYTVEQVLEELLILQPVVVDALTPLCDEARSVVDRFFQVA